LRFCEVPDEVIEHRGSICSCCQQDLREVEACVTLRRQVVDIPSPRLIVQEHRAGHKQCPRCQHLTLASFPPAVAAPSQYGPLIGAVSVYLTQQQLLPLERTCEVLRDLLGVQMSEATDQKGVEPGGRDSSRRNGRLGSWQEILGACHQYGDADPLSGASEPRTRRVERHWHLARLQGH